MSAQVIESDTLEFEESYEEAKQLKETYFGVNMDRFVKHFEERKATIPTETIKMEPRHAKALLHLCRRVRSNTKLENDEDLKTIDELTQSINQVMQKLRKENNLSDQNGFIVKLTSRSPKDVTPNHEKTRRIYQELLGTMYNPSHFENDEYVMNEHLCALFFASLQCMRVYDAKEALDLLSLSSRIEYDLSLDLTFEKEFSLGLIIRPWDTDMRLQSEFRGIVFDNQLKCLTQYFTQCYLEPVVTHKEMIEKACRKFFEEEAKPTLSQHVPEMKNYIIDFSVSENGNVKLLEINPYLTTTGVGLFDWDEDREKFESATSTFEFRVHTKPIVRSKLLGTGLLVKEWENILKDSVKK